jgi:protein-S-isoprenylcysteine O-methyltransferase Ste14
VIWWMIQGEHSWSPFLASTRAKENLSVLATWVFMIGLPVYLVNSLPPSLHPTLGWTDYAALGLATISFLIEIVADEQKSSWRSRRERKLHDDRFISSGLWSVSRHPKYVTSESYVLQFIFYRSYVGEVGIHTGIWAMTVPSLLKFSSPLYAVGLAGPASPIFTYYALRYVSALPPSSNDQFSSSGLQLSGVPPLQRAGDKKWAGDPKWEEYKRCDVCYCSVSSSSQTDATSTSLGLSR